MIASAPFPMWLSLKKAVFAIHPGGPKIIDSIAHGLDLSEEQVSASIKILKSRGNMSSATLPHVWQQILSENYEDRQPIVSLAFGPGLSIFGSIFEISKGQL